MSFAFFGARLIAVEQKDVNSGSRRDIGNAGAHEPRPDDAEPFHARFGSVRRAARALGQILHGYEQRADHVARLRPHQQLGEMPGLYAQRGIEGLDL